MIKKVKNFATNHPDICATIAVSAAVLALFLPSFNFSRFVFDDAYYVGQMHLFEFSFSNICYHLTHKTVDLYSPLVMLSYMPDCLVWGKEYFISGCRVQNILWHLIAAILLYRIFREFKIQLKDKILEIPPSAALFSVLCWALHPQRMESVIWIAERKDVMVMVFALSSLLCIIRAHHRNRTSIAAPFLLLLSLFTIKPLLLTFPLLVFVGFMTVSHCDIKLSFKRTWPLFLAVFIYIVKHCTMFAQIASSSLSGASGETSRLPVAALNILKYAFKTLFPVKLSPLYPLYEANEVSWLPVFILILLATAVAAAACRKAPEQQFFASILLPGGLMFGLAAAPICNFYRIGNVDFADRYSYFPSIFIWCGVALLLTAAWEKFKEHHRKAIFCAAAAYFAVLLTLSVSYMIAWRSGSTQIDAMLDCEKPHYSALQLATAEAYLNNDYPEALRYASLITREDDMLKFFRECTTGLVLAKLGREDDGFKHISGAFAGKLWRYLDKVPRNMRRDCINFMIHCQQKRKDSPTYKGNMVFLCKLGAQVLLNTDQPESLNFSGAVLLLQQDYPAAVQFYTRAAAEFPANENIRKNLGSAKKKDSSDISFIRF